MNFFKLQQHLPFMVLKRRASAANLHHVTISLQQYLPFTVCDAGCETAEEQSDDEVRTSQVPERSEGKTKVIRQQSLPFTVLKPSLITYCFIHFSCFVATAPTVYGIETEANNVTTNVFSIKLQQHLLFTVLKRSNCIPFISTKFLCCNSPYRLRY